MPNRDGTGPLGKGTQTGRRFGRCKTSDTNDTSMPGGRNKGGGMDRNSKEDGGGQGRRRRWWNTGR